MDNIMEIEVTETHVSDDGQNRCIHYADGGVVIVPNIKLICVDCGTAFYGLEHKEDTCPACLAKIMGKL